MPDEGIFSDTKNEAAEDFAVMADMWDLGQYVEDHPDAYEQRWRLAKKLYLACEYRLVLEHLQILKNEWTPKLNVVRYLAATYYRLGRYDESISELEEAIIVWPDEVGLREQLARVLEIAGDPEQASAVWEEVQRLDPDHALAKSASERLISSHDRSPQDDLHIQESDSGIDLAPKRVCPACGAQNSIEFDRCWQCRAPLVPGAAGGVLAGVAGAPLPGVEERGNSLRRVFNIFAGLFFVALVAYGVYLGINGLPSQEAPPGIVVTPTVYAALFESLFNVRLVIGLMLLVAWPIVLFIALNFVSSDQPNPGIVVLAGIILAALGATAAWAPLHTIPELLVLIGLSSFLAIFTLFEISVRDTIVVWLVQLLAMPLAAAGAVVAVEGPSAFLEAPAIITFAAKHDRAVLPEFRFEAPPASVTAQYGIVWKSSGSSWLDRKLSTVQFELTHRVQANTLSFDLKDKAQDKTLLFTKASASPFRTEFTAEAGKAYALSVRGDPELSGSPLNLVVYSLLKPTLTNEQPAAPSGH